MALFHKTRKKQKRKQTGTDASHLNWMGGPSYGLSDPLTVLRVAASSCFFGEPMYYHRDGADERPQRKRPASRLSAAGLEHLRETLNAADPVEWRALAPAELIEQAIDAALAADPEATLAEAVRLRTVENMRTTPQVILVRAGNHPAVRGTGLIRRYAPQIIARPDEPAVGLAYQLWRYGKPVPNGLKKAWAAALNGYGPQQLAKYRLENRGVKTVDVINLVHAKSEAIDRLCKGELALQQDTWESLISARGASRESWEQAVEVMGHMALLRNLRNLLSHEVPTSRFLDKLVAGAAKGKQLPFRYYSAYQAIKDKAPGPVLDGVEACLMQSLGNLPRFPGRVMSLCDNSGSAQGTTTSSMGTMKVSTIANLTGVLAGMRADEGHLGVFGDRLERLTIRPRASVFDQLDRAEGVAKDIGMGTENGIWLFWDQAIRNREHWDTVFVFSDMQAGHGGLYGTDPGQYRDYKWQGSNYIDVPQLIAAYRAKVNPKVQVFLVQVAGYQDTIVPEFYERTFILGGWSDGLLRFAAAMAELDGRKP
ncbi:MAG: TROVE domain-containing protein, partial [Myxococcales bacterium]|nr:TROVE domain-containing protein [Myxococcales bacterium]